MYKLFNKTENVFDYVRATISAQNDLFAVSDDPRRLYKPDNLEQIKLPGRFALCHKLKGEARLKQELFDVDRLDWVIRYVQKMDQRESRHFYISQATLKPNAWNRRISSICLLNGIWVDIDLSHPPKGFDINEMPYGDPVKDADRLANLLAIQLTDANIPPPTCIIATGGGLCAKWLFTSAVPMASRARWQSVQQQIVRKVSELCGHWAGVRSWRWPVDFGACDASRILRLVGTHNPRWDAPCRIALDTGLTHDFEDLADSLLKYSREEVRHFRKEINRYKEWDKNRAKAAELAIRLGRSNLKPLSANDTWHLLQDEAVRSLWTSRFEFGSAILRERGVTVGNRNNYYWPLAVALAWSCTASESLYRELAALHQDLFRSDGWTYADALSSASSVLTRMKAGTLYQMTTAVFLQKLEVKSEEMQRFGHMLGSSGHNAKRSDWQSGVMGFEKMNGLSFEEFVGETRRRQAEAGRRSAQMRNTTYGNEKRSASNFLASEGLSSREIARQLGVNQSTVVRWLSQR